MFFLGIRETLPQPARPHFALDIAKPTTAEQQAAWAAALGDDAAAMPARLAGQFNLNLAQDSPTRALGENRGEGFEAPLAEKIWAICRASERPRLDALAQRLEPKVTWDDLVLPAEEMSCFETNRRAGRASQSGLSATGDSSEK